MKFQLFVTVLIAGIAFPCQAQRENTPPPCTVSIATLGQLNPTRYIGMKEYLSRYGGRDPEADESFRKAIAEGVAAPVPVPEEPDERPPGPLLVHLDRKTRKALEFSLNAGTLSKRFPVLRGGNLDLYLASAGASSASVMEGKKGKIHSIPIDPSCEEMVVFFIKPPTSSWKGYQMIPMDLSPKRVPARSILLANFSKRELLIRPDVELTPEAESKNRILLKPGASIVYKAPANLQSLRMMYSDPAAPDRVLSSVNFEAQSDQRSVAATFGLGTPENGVSVATRCFRFPLAGITGVSSVSGVRDLPEGDSSFTE